MFTTHLGIIIPKMLSKILVVQSIIDEWLVLGKEQNNRDEISNNVLINKTVDS